MGVGTNSGTRTGAAVNRCGAALGALVLLAAGMGGAQAVTSQPDGPAGSGQERVTVTGPANALEATETGANVADPQGDTETGAQRASTTWTDPAGISAPLHLWAPAHVRARGLVVYLDGDDQNGVADPDSPYVLGGDTGLVAAATRAGYAVLAPRAPDGRTWWRDGPRNADYLRALVARARYDLAVEPGPVWWVGYSGGSQLITKWLLPSYQGAPPTGGALLLGGGGPPDQRPPIPQGYPIYWYTGTADDGTTSSDRYDAISDARRGALAYYTAGARALMSTPDGIGHDVTHRAGTLLASLLP